MFCCLNKKNTEESDSTYSNKSESEEGSLNGNKVSFNCHSVTQWVIVGAIVASVAATTFGLLAYFTPFEAAALMSAQTGFHIAAASLTSTVIFSLILMSQVVTRSRDYEEATCLEKLLSCSQRPEPKVVVNNNLNNISSEVGHSNIN